MSSNIKYGFIMTLGTVKKLGQGRHGDKSSVTLESKYDILIKRRADTKHHKWSISFASPLVTWFRQNTVEFTLLYIW